MFSPLLLLYSYYLDYYEQKFRSYQNLPHELRKHVLSYATKKSLFNYAQSSKLSSQEVEAQNIDPAYQINITELDCGLLMEFQYFWNSRKHLVLFVENMAHVTEDLRNQIQPSAIIEGDPIQELKKHIDENFRLVEGPATKRLHIDFKNWPNQLLEFEKFRNIQEFGFAVYECAKEDFMAYINGVGANIRNLTLKKGDAEFLEDHRFYQTRFFKKLKPIQCLGRIKLHLVEDSNDPEDFEEDEGRKTDEMIRERIEVWLQDPHLDFAVLQTRGRYEDRNMSVMFKSISYLQYITPTIGIFSVDDDRWICFNFDSLHCFTLIFGNGDLLVNLEDL